MILIRVLLNNTPIKSVKFDVITGEYIGSDAALIGTNIKGMLKLLKNKNRR